MTRKIPFFLPYYSTCCTRLCGTSGKEWIPNLRHRMNGLLLSRMKEPQLTCSLLRTPRKKKKTSHAFINGIRVKWIKTVPVGVCTAELKSANPENYFIYKSKVTTVVEDDSKAPFSIATAQRCKRGRYCYLWVVPLYPGDVPYNVKQGGIKYHF